MKVYVKRLKLKEWVKEFLLVSLMFAIVITGFVGYVEQVKKINSGEIDVVYQYGGDV